MFLSQPRQLCWFGFILSPLLLLVLTYTEEGNEELTKHLLKLSLSFALQNEDLDQDLESQALYKELAVTIRKIHRKCQ